MRNSPLTMSANFARLVRLFVVPIMPLTGSRAQLGHIIIKKNWVRSYESSLLTNRAPSLQCLLQVCERIPTIGTQLKILSTVKATMLGAQGQPSQRPLSTVSEPHFIHSQKRCLLSKFFRSPDVSRKSISSNIIICADFVAY